MTDWSEYLARGRHRIEAAFWLLAASVVVLVVLAGAALATWLDLRAGEENALDDAILVELDSLPPVEALAELPEVPQPEPETVTPEAPQPEPVVEETPPEPVVEDTPPEPEVAPEPPKPEVADALPEVAPEPPPVQKAEVKPEPTPKPKKPKKPKPVRKAEAKPEPQAKPQPSQAGRAGSQAPKGAVTASQRAKWYAKVHGQLARQLKKKSFGAKGAMMSLVVTVNGSGAVTNIRLVGSTGDAKIDNAVLVQARRLRSVAAPPDGKGDRLELPVVLR
jgi:protein TonB